MSILLSIPELSQTFFITIQILEFLDEKEASKTNDAAEVEPIQDKKEDLDVGKVLEYL